MLSNLNKKIIKIRYKILNKKSFIIIIYKNKEIKIKLIIKNQINNNKRMIILRNLEILY